MTEQQANEAWAALPDYAKKLARNLYNTSNVEQYQAVLELLFGINNLVQFKKGDVVFVTTEHGFGRVIQSISEDTIIVDMGDKTVNASVEKLIPSKSFLQAFKERYDKSNIASSEPEEVNSDGTYWVVHINKVDKEAYNNLRGASDDRR